MRSDWNAWPLRLLAAVTVLASVFAGVIGAYAHAAGHAQPSQVQEEILGAATDRAVIQHDAAAGCPDAAERDCGQHNRGDTGHSGYDGCDSICHGGQAILADSAMVLHPPRYAPLIQLATACDGTSPDSLDRPPKSPASV